MIKLHRIRGEEFFLNADLVESVASTPDTVVTLFDGRKVVVGESAEEVVDRIRAFRASVIRLADELRAGRADLVAFPGGKDD